MKTSTLKALVAFSALLRERGQGNLAILLEVILEREAPATPAERARRYRQRKKARHAG